MEIKSKHESTDNKKDEKNQTVTSHVWKKKIKYKKTKTIILCTQTLFILHDRTVALLGIVCYFFKSVRQELKKCGLMPDPCNIICNSIMCSVSDMIANIDVFFTFKDLNLSPRIILDQKVPCLMTCKSPLIFDVAVL